MNAIQQKCRPKHQVLVLKCYPRTTKGAVDVKPNSSELSYLLFYAQSRRSKIQKVGAFLEKKTASDVYRLRIGNVQVTLQILAALVDKAAKDLPLFAPSILKILEQILRSKDITMVESSIPTFEAFCEHHDPTSLLADEAYRQQYVALVREYAGLASTRFVPPGKTPISKPMSLRWRNAGLEAIRCVAASEALSSLTGRQYDVAVPMILENLWTDNEDFLEILLQRADVGDKEKEEAGGILLKRRTSVATVRTADTGGAEQPNPIALAGSAVDVDKLAEEDIGVLAMQCLKQIFGVPNRSQIHAATLALLRFIQERINQQEDVVRTHVLSGKDSGWAIKMFGLVSRWAPVQDRFTILITTVDKLAQTPLTDDSMQHHIVLTAMIRSLLRSDQNLIGLSVMDVLLQLLAHVRKLVQMPGDPSGGTRGVQLGPGQPDTRSQSTVHLAEMSDKAVHQRKKLLERLQNTIGDLATHVYYADQISDMILTILVKLRPSRSTSTSSSSPQGEKVEAASAVPQSATSTDQHLDSLFSLTVAKTTALKAIKNILLVANPQSQMSGHMGLSRNRVPIQVWEGTQWLLRDPDGHVRKAFADALVTWLDRETTSADLRARDDTFGHRLKHREFPTASRTRRAVSSASSRGDKQVKTPRSYFLPLLHVAIYDNALQYTDYETDVVLLHVLLAKLVSQLGINAVRYGLPMVFRLQEDIQDVDTPLAKVRIGALVHGYFWILTEKFEFDGTIVGKAIHNEIIRRRSKQFWVEGVHIPPPMIDLIGTPGFARPQPKLLLREIETEALLPFDDRLSIIESVCNSYHDRARSPPASPVATSPGRNFTHPIMSSTLSSIPVINGDSAAELEVPAQFREEMLSEWSRESVVMAVQVGSKSGSLHGTTGTSGNNRNRLAVHNNLNGVVAAADGPHPVFTLSTASPGQRLRPSTAPGNELATMPKLRQSSVRSHMSRAAGQQQDVVSVEQLKLALSGHISPRAAGDGLTTDDDDGSDDSLISYDVAPSELSFNPYTNTSNPDEATNGVAITTNQIITPSLKRLSSRDTHDAATGTGRRYSASGGPLSSHPMREVDEADEEDEDATPPVPPLPAGVEGARVSVLAPAATLPRPPASARRSVKSIAGSRRSERFASAGWTAENVNGIGAAPATDLASLLKGIDSGVPGRMGLGGVTKPPY